MYNLLSTKRHCKGWSIENKVDHIFFSLYHRSGSSDLAPIINNDFFDNFKTLNKSSERRDRSNFLFWRKEAICFYQNLGSEYKISLFISI